MDLQYLRRETRYGVPAADKILFNRHYVLGYSYYFRQAKWALEIVDSSKDNIERSDNFRADYRILADFRADLADYVNSKYDRGHLVASANQIGTNIQNSETFLLSNMSPQQPEFNRQIWRKFEDRIRKLNNRKSIYETYVISGPVFYFDKEVKCIGSTDENGVTLPVPHAYFKSVLTENSRGHLHMWSFILPNKKIHDELDSFLVSTKKLEKIAGIELWENLSGRKIEKEKSKIRKLWW
jgi:endonuclease G, mitochondrial